MKKTMSVMALCALLALVISCGKKEEAAAPSQAEIQKQVTTAATEIQKAAETQTAAAQKTVTETVQKAATEATQSATQQTATQAAQSAASSADAEAKGARALADFLLAPTVQAVLADFGQKTTGRGPPGTLAAPPRTPTAVPPALPPAPPRGRAQRARGRPGGSCRKDGPPRRTPRPP
jgi:hypothetical protein